MTEKATIASPLGTTYTVGIYSHSESGDVLEVTDSRGRVLKRVQVSESRPDETHTMTFEEEFGEDVLPVSTDVEPDEGEESEPPMGVLEMTAHVYNTLQATLNHDGNDRVVADLTGVIMQRWLEHVVFE